MNGLRLSSRRPVAGCNRYRVRSVLYDRLGNVPFAPPIPMAPAISPLVYFSSNILVPPSTITAAASWRERSLITCQDAPAASATRAPETSAADTVCDFMDRSTIHGVAPAFARTWATKRASLLFVSIVAKTAIIGLDALNNASRAAVLLRLAGDTRQTLLPEEVRT